MASSDKPCKIHPNRPNSHGYVPITIREGFRRRTVGAHRIALERKLGRPIREGFSACHTCDTPNCVEEDHLFEGTQRDNLRDASRKGRLPMYGGFRKRER